MLGYELRLMGWIKASSPKAHELDRKSVARQFQRSAKLTI